MASRRAQEPIETRVVSDIRPDPRTPRAIAREFQDLLESGASLLPAGAAKDDPDALLTPSYLPRFRLDLFDATYWIASFRRDDHLDYFVAYVGLRHPTSGVIRRVYPRIFYKDLSLVWRVATHLVQSHDEHWIGKGDVRWEELHDGEYLCTAEETTNLPLEIQGALDDLSRSGPKPRRDTEAMPLVLKTSAHDRIQPYADFTRPRVVAAERFEVNGGKRIARFTRRGDPSSLRFANGYEPDFLRGHIETSSSGSRMFGGLVRKFRVLSTNRIVQFQFVATPRFAWMNPPQTLTTELMTYGCRSVDVHADEEAFVPAFEYHYLDDSVDPPELHSQIPEGYAGEPSDEDPHRVDASAWIEKLPVIQQFRAELLRRPRPRGRRRAR